MKIFEIDTNWKNMLPTCFFEKALQIWQPGRGAMVKIFCIKKSSNWTLGIIYWSSLEENQWHSSDTLADFKSGFTGINENE